MARRGDGEGTVFRRADGRWAASLRLEDGGRKWLYGQTKQEVQRKLAVLRRTVEDGLSVTPERGTVGDYLTDWLETIRPSLQESGWDSHQYFVERHISPRIGWVRLAKLSPQQVQQLYAACLTAGLSNTTVNHLHGTLHKALDDAMRLGLVARNVTELVNAPRVDHREMRPLTLVEARTLLESSHGRGDRLLALWSLAIATGMRRGEVLALHWMDVQLAGPRGHALSVRWNLRYRGGVFTFKEPKTRRSRRRIALASETVEMLRAHRTRQKVERLRAGEVWQENDLVFCTEAGTPLSANGGIRSTFERVLRRAALPAIRFHDLRHTCASLLLAENVNPKVVSELLGHATVAITLDIYSHVMPDMQEDVATVIGALLYGTRSATM